jgi:hypothetical protein
MKYIKLFNESEFMSTALTVLPDNTKPANWLNNTYKTGESYKIGDTVVFKYVLKDTNYEYEIRIGDIIDISYQFYVIQTNYDSYVGKYLIPENRILNIATEKNIKNYNVDKVSRKFNI